MIVMRPSKKQLRWASLMAGISLLISGNALANWQIDGNRLKESVHEEISCLECHLKIENSDRHPNPTNIYRHDRIEFEPEACFQCHDDVQTQIADEKSHGGADIEDPGAFYNCIQCHNPHYEGAPQEASDDHAIDDFSDEDQECLECHQQTHADAPNHLLRIQNLCFSCHATGQSMPASVPVMDRDEYQQSPHAGMDCLACHFQAMDQDHHNRQIRTQCRECHLPHAESVAHDAHINVSCEACHLQGGMVVREKTTHAIRWQGNKALAGTPTRLHNLSKPDGEGCTRCHHPGNAIGAATMVLPAKSILCMPCHPATFSIADATTLISLVVFAIGFLSFASLCFSCAGNRWMDLRRAAKTIFSWKILGILGTFWYDVLLQRRLFRQSPRRWAIHAMIFWPMTIRFLWGIVGLLATTFLKSWPIGWELIDKNNPATALLFDVTGICLAIGIIIALDRGSRKNENRLPGLPPQDLPALFLMGGIVAVGFLLEGLRIALTGADGPATWAFLGYHISLLFKGMTGLDEFYGYIWYLHAILTGAFVAYLPFSRMMHIIMSPVILAINASGEKNSH